MVIFSMASRVNLHLALGVCVCVSVVGIPGLRVDGVRESAVTSPTSEGINPNVITIQASAFLGYWLGDG